MPAPPPESEPAIVSAVGTVISLGVYVPRAGGTNHRDPSMPELVVRRVGRAEDVGAVEGRVEVGIEVVGLEGDEVGATFSHDCARIVR